MGKEYGFVLRTVSNSGRTGYQNHLLIIDFEVLNYSEIPNKIGYRIEPILQAYVETENRQGAWCVVQPIVWAGFEFKIQNITMGVNLHNENESNDGDSYYNFEQDTGDVLSEVRMTYKAFSDQRKDDGGIKKWMADFVCSKGLDKLADAGIPYLSVGARLINKICGYAKEGSGFFNAEHVEELTKSLTNKDDPCASFKPKYGANGSQYAQGKYIRNAYLHLQKGSSVESDEAPNQDIYLLPSNATEQEGDALINGNGYVDMVMKTQGEVANSRIVFGAAFEIGFRVLDESVLVQNSDNRYEFVATDLPNAIPVLLTSVAEYKMYRKESELTGTVDKAHLLDGEGYELYTFRPKFHNDYAFGKYKFSVSPYGTSQPSTRIYLLKYVPLDVNTIINMSREELLSNGYVLAYNNTSNSDLWNLEYTFTDQGSDSLNTYYILYKYSFDYTGKGEYFWAKSEFTPDVLQENQSVATYLDSNKKIFYAFAPSESSNYFIRVEGIASYEVKVYEGQSLIGTETGMSLHALLYGDRSYIIEVKNIGSGNTASIGINRGSQVVLNAYEYKATYSIQAYQTQYFRFVPQNMSGTYQVNGAAINSLQVSWYDRQFREIPVQSNAAFLSKGETYYIELRNISLYDTSGSFQVVYQNDILAFFGEIAPHKDDYKQYLAYKLTGSNADGVNKTVSISVNGNTVCSNAVFSGNEFVFDLSRCFFDGGNITLNCEVCINGTEKCFLPTIRITTPVLTYTYGMKIADEYSHLKFANTADYADACLTVPASVKVLSIESNWNYYIRGIRLNVDYSVEPLVINIKNIDWYAPSNISTIISARDIIFNCFGTVRLTGGNGIDDGNLSRRYGMSAVEMTDNTFIINGSGTLTLAGGKGGNTSAGKMYAYNSTAGKGGTAVSVGNLVINVYKLAVKGGTGGNGGAGRDGANGQDGVGYQSNGIGAKGADGESGNYGCGGGYGGVGILTTGRYCAVYSSNLTVTGGMGGNGGRGGNGGKGGNGAPGKNGNLFGGQTAGGNGGNGGRGYDGGNYGSGMVAVNSIREVVNFTNIDFTEMFQKWASDGIAGSGGIGGKGGTGGLGGESKLGKRAASGANGRDGANGNPGGSPAPRQSLSTERSVAYKRDILNAYLVADLGAQKAREFYGIQITNS